MKLQRHRVDNDKGEWCLSEDVAALEAENEFLRAEIERLKADGKNERHPDDVAVDDFAKAMKDKMKVSREKGRRGWELANAQYLAAQLIYHVKKGDPVDVANFCMMLHSRWKSDVLSRAWVAQIEHNAPHKVLEPEQVTKDGPYWFQRRGGTAWTVMYVFPRLEVRDGLYIGPMTPPEV